MNKRVIYLLMLGLLLVFSISCGGKDEEEEGGGETAEPAAPAGPKYAPTGKEGTLTGTIKFEGTPPTPIKIQMEGDDYCIKANPNAVSETVVVNDGKLQYALVYVKDGPSTKYSYDKPAEPVILDQKGCQYRPHVLALQAKQELKVTTSDDTTHNIHPQPKNNKEWNKSQPPKGDPILESFARPELIPVKCNQHPWMKAFIGVFNHPFFAVTDKDGKYEIKGLPPGEYTIEAWQEKLGTTTQKVTIGEGKTETLDFSSANFKTQSAGMTGGLKLGAALVLPSCCPSGHQVHKQ